MAIRRPLQLTITDLIAGGIGEGFIQDREHAEHVHLGHVVLSNGDTHRGKFSWAADDGREGSSAACSAAPPTYLRKGLPGRRTMSRIGCGFIDCLRACLSNSWKYGVRVRLWRGVGASG